MKNVIEQIRKIKGVVTVEQFGTNGAVVLFELRPPKIAVKCTDQKQFEFVWSKTNKSKLDGTEFMAICSRDGGHFDSIDLEQNSGMQDSAWFKGAGYKVITFGRYLDDNDIVNEWSTFNKPKSLTPEELMDGRIYVDEKDKRTIRVKSLSRKGVLDLYSQHIPRFNNGGSLNQTSTYCLIESKLREATIEEQKSHIKFEIERDYFHELK